MTRSAARRRTRSTSHVRRPTNSRVSNHGNNGHVDRLVQRRKSASKVIPAIAIILEIDCHEGRRHLPIIRVRQAA